MTTKFEEMVAKAGEEPFGMLACSELPWTQDLKEIRKLQDNWDGEGAPIPTEEAIQRAQRIMIWALEAELSVTDLSADVMGGVGFYLQGRNKSRHIITFLRNKGDFSVILVNEVEKSTKGLPTNDSHTVKQVILEYLNAVSLQEVRTDQKKTPLEMAEAMDSNTSMVEFVESLPLFPDVVRKYAHALGGEFEVTLVLKTGQRIRIVDPV